MASVSLLWSKFMAPQQFILIRKLLKYSLHLTDSDLWGRGGVSGER